MSQNDLIETHDGKTVGTVVALDKTAPYFRTMSQEIVDLVASMLAVHAPLAEVLAVILENVVVIFTESQARATHHFISIEPT
jgi:hypothetical protein